MKPNTDQMRMLGHYAVDDTTAQQSGNCEELKNGELWLRDRRRRGRGEQATDEDRSDAQAN